MDIMAIAGFTLGLASSIVAISLHVRLSRIEIMVEKELVEPVQEIAALEERAKELFRQSM